MKLILLFGVVVSLAGCLTTKTQKATYLVTTTEFRAECPVVVSDVPEWAQQAVVKIDKREVASQLDRALNELAFVANIDGSQEVEVVYSSAPATTSYPNRVHAQMWLENADKTLLAVDTIASDKDDMYEKLLHHGPAFESEYAAYRIFFDRKQTVDTYGKKRPQLELATTMWSPSDEQLAAGYGHDNLRVFGSVGLGTLKGWDGERQQMIHIDDFRRREARIVAKGPVRTIVEMEVDGWRYGNREISMTSRYILYAGHSEVRVENRIKGDLTGLLFTTGVVKMAQTEVVRSGPTIVACGCDYPEDDTHKWEREYVALAIDVPPGQVASQIDDATSYLFQLTPDAAGRIDYVFDMRWRKSEWVNNWYLGECKMNLIESVRLATHPIVVSRIR